MEWDVFKIAHHCSYLALGPEKGKTRTQPVEEVAWLFEDQGHSDGIIVSTRCPIPNNDDSDLPPHRQAANYYQEVADDKDGEFRVTMEHPDAANPKPLVIWIDQRKATLEKAFSGGVAAIVSRPAPRAG
jgi:hypothetical protein